MLPYSPLHHLLLNEFTRPLVATSANISGEPVLTLNQDIEKKLAHVADGFLHHNRKIQRPADDPVYRTIANMPRPMSNGRGMVQLEKKSPFELKQPDSCSERTKEKYHHTGVEKSRGDFTAYW